MCAKSTSQDDCDGIHANIHHFYPHPMTKDVAFDFEGDPMLGYYYEILDVNKRPLSDLMGPYATAEAAEAACRAEYNSDYA